MPMRVLVLMSLLAGVVACGDDTPTAPTETPTRTAITEPPFSGTLTVNGAATHSFSTGSGQIVATLTTLSPDSAAIIGVSLGTWNGTTCQWVLANDNATQGATVVGNAGTTGAFCARVYDVGRLEAPTDYTLTVVHF